MVKFLSGQGSSLLGTKTSNSSHHNRCLDHKFWSLLASPQDERGLDNRLEIQTHKSSGAQNYSSGSTEMGSSINQFSCESVSNNKTAVACVKRQGSHRYFHLHDLVTLMWDVANAYRFILTAEYIPGNLNVIVDAGKCQATHFCESLPRSNSSKRIHSRLGTVEKDLFVSPDESNPCITSFNQETCKKGSS